MAGQGLRCPNRPRMSQIPDSNMDPKGVKYPYFTGGASAPQSTSNKQDKYCSKFYYQQKVGLSVFAHFG